MVLNRNIYIELCSAATLEGGGCLAGFVGEGTPEKWRREYCTTHICVAAFLCDWYLAVIRDNSHKTVSRRPRWGPRRICEYIVLHEIALLPSICNSASPIVGVVAYLYKIDVGALLEGKFLAMM